MQGIYYTKGRSGLHPTTLLLAPAIAALDVVDTTIWLRLASSVGRVRRSVTQLVQGAGQLGTPILPVDVVIG